MIDLSAGVPSVPATTDGAGYRWSHLHPRWSDARSMAGISGSLTLFGGVLTEAAVAESIPISHGRWENPGQGIRRRRFAIRHLRAGVFAVECSQDRGDGGGSWLSSGASDSERPVVGVPERATGRLWFRPPRSAEPGDPRYE